MIFENKVTRLTREGFVELFFSFHSFIQDIVSKVKKCKTFYTIYNNNTIYYIYVRKHTCKGNVRGLKTCYKAYNCDVFVLLSILFASFFHVSTIFHSWFYFGHFYSCYICYTVRGPVLGRPQFSATFCLFFAPQMNLNEKQLFSQVA